MEKELIAETVGEFKDAMLAARLNLTAAKRFAMFRELLEEPFRSEYDIIKADHNITNPGFAACLTAFINRYFLATDFEDECLYLDTTKKPFKVSVDELASRLGKINKMLSLLTADGANPFTQNQLKLKFFRMMPRPWQVRFVQQGNLLSAPGQTFERVRQYFAIQESTGKLLNDNKKQTSDNDDDLGPASGKRAHGRGGRYNRGGGQQSGRDSE